MEKVSREVRRNVSDEYLSSSSRGDPRIQLRRTREEENQRVEEYRQSVVKITFANDPEWAIEGLRRAKESFKA
jgi:hypothetical protein